MEDTKWLYYKITVGKYSWALDCLIVESSKLMRDKRILQWFYLRFMDEDGIQLRLRLQVPARLAEGLDVEFYAKLHDLTTEMASLPIEESNSLVKMPLSSGMKLSSKLIGVGVKRMVYEPEVNIYGGVAGVKIAEELFHASSCIAADLIERERFDYSFSRKDAAPCLFLTALEVFRVDKQPVAFLEDYIKYWYSGDTTIISYLEAFNVKASNLIAQGYPIVSKDNDYPESFLGNLELWRKKLQSTELKIRKSSAIHFSELLLERCLFYFIHLMNNRLGFSILEEVYLATLVKHVAVSNLYESGK